jgi:enoyl-CoA hydratase/carnithine racemase
VRVAVIRGRGRAFTAGMDVNVLAGLDVAGAKALITALHEAIHAVHAAPFPVIAALNGHALGGGAEVAVAADIRVAADDIKIGFTQVRLAIMPAWGGAERLADLVGRNKALLLIGTGQTLDASDAERIGLLDVVAPRAGFEEAWRSLASQLAALGPDATRSIKATIAAARPHHHPSLEADAVRAFAKLWVSEAHWNAAARLDGKQRQGSQVPQT